MRAKCVNEKFNVETDPIHDMGIGETLTDIARIAQMYHNRVPGFYLTRKDFFIMYHPTSSEPLWRHVDKVEGPYSKENKMRRSFWSIRETTKLHEKFTDESDPIKDMEIGDIAVKRNKVGSHIWTITDDFLNQIIHADFGYNEYMGYHILTYKAGSRWWSVTSRDHKDKVVSSSGGKASLTKESALKDIQSKIRRRKRILKTFEEDESKISI